MPLNLINIKPGFNKQITVTAAEGQYVDGDFVRFSTGLPEKIGGWRQLTNFTVVGVVRSQHQWTDIEGRKYSVLGSNKGLFLYYEGVYYDITPLNSGQANTFTSSNSSDIVTILSVNHGLQVGDLTTFSSVTLPGAGATTFVDTDFTSNTFEIQSVTTNTFTIKMSANELGTGMTNQGSGTIKPYVSAGQTFQTFAYGFGTGLYGGTLASTAQTTLSSGINDSVTTIPLTSTSAFPASGTILIENELITYAAKTPTDLTGATRGANGTTAAAHTTSPIVYNATNFVGWGQASNASTVALEPGMWSLDNFGQTLIATAIDGATYQWSPIASNAAALTTRATISINNPTASVMTMVSDQDGHLFHLGTETIIGDTGSQDKMFIRFSTQENNEVYEPTSTNSAGTFRLSDGTEIRGAIKAKDYILIFTDTSAYTIQFVGPPFVFSIRKVGSNCGLMGRNACAFANGAVFWMDDSGAFNIFDGTVRTIPCSVEDFVFSTANPGDLGLNFDAGKIITCGLNTLFKEISWYYPSQGSLQINRVVTFNYDEGIWFTGSLSRTSYADTKLYNNPYACYFNSTGLPSFPTTLGQTTVNGASTYFEHEVGLDQITYSTTGAATTTPIVSFIQSGDFALHIDGDGEIFTKIRRFIPDFKRLYGNAEITIYLKDYPSETAVSSPLGPFTIDSSVDKVDTRARGRAASLRIANTGSSESWRYGTFRADVQPDGRR
jgi:hypothetical protein